MAIYSNGTSIANAATLNATTLTGNLPAISGASLTTLNATNISSGTLASARFSGGKVLQLVSSSKTAVQTTTSTSYVEVTDMTCDITPSSTSNKIWIQYCFSCGTSGSDELRSTLFRDTTDLELTSEGYGTTSMPIFDGIYQGRFVSYTYLDSPSSTSSLTYHLKFKSNDGTEHQIMGRGHSSSDSWGGAAFTVMEIQG